MSRVASVITDTVLIGSEIGCIGMKKSHCLLWGKEKADGKRAHGDYYNLRDHLLLKASHHRVDNDRHVVHKSTASKT